MDSFHTQLAAARKKKRLTQEQLAELMNVSRPTVSRWENGHILPDIETVKRLMSLLEYDFIAGRTLTDTPPAILPQPELPPAPEAKEPSEITDPASGEENKEKTPAPRKRRAPLLIAAALIALCLLLALLFSSSPDLPTPEPYSLAWFEQEQKNNVPGQAFREIKPLVNPLKAVRRDQFQNGVGWLFEFSIEEKNGVMLTVDSCSITLFHESGASRTDVCAQEAILRTFGSKCTAYPNAHYAFSGGFPRQPLQGLGLVVSGTDAHGNTLSFRGFLELSQEIDE